MCSYKLCVKFGVSYKVGASADIYLRCTSKNLECSLIPFSPAKWKRLQKKRADKAVQLRETLARLNCIYKEIEQFEKQSVQIVDNEVANIEDLKSEEVLEDFSEFSIDVASEQPEFPINFDQSFFAAGPLAPVVAGTVAEASGSF